MGFEKCHPAVNFIYFATVISGMMVFQHPIFLLISFACAFFIQHQTKRLESIGVQCHFDPLRSGFCL